MNGDETTMTAIESPRNGDLALDDLLAAAGRIHVALIAHAPRPTEYSVEDQTLIARTSPVSFELRSPAGDLIAAPPTSELGWDLVRAFGDAVLPFIALALKPFSDDARRELHDALASGAIFVLKISRGARVELALERGTKRVEVAAALLPR